MAKRTTWLTVLLLAIFLRKEVSSQIVSVPFEPPPDIAVLVGIPKVSFLNQFRFPEPETGYWELLDLLARTDPHNGEASSENSTTTSEVWSEAFKNIPEDTSMWVVVSDSSDSVGEVAIVLSHPGMLLNEKQKDLINELAQTAFEFFPRLFSGEGNQHQARMFERLSLWETNHVVAFLDSATIVSSSNEFLNQIKTPLKGGSVRQNRSFKEAGNYGLKDSGAFVYIAPAQAKAMVLGTGVVFEDYWDRHDCNELPWILVSIKPSALDFSGISYKTVVKSTLPLVNRNRYWSSYREIEWVPDFGASYRRVFGRNIDLDKFKRIATVVDSELVDSIKGFPLLLWFRGISRTEVGGLRFGLAGTISDDGLSSSDLLERVGTFEFIEPDTERDHIEELVEEHFSTYASEVRRIGGFNPFGGELRKGEHSGYPAWHSPDNKESSYLAVLTNAFLFEGSKTVFDELVTQESLMRKDPLLLRRLNSLGSTLEIDDPIVAFEIDRAIDVSGFVSFVLNQLMRRFPDHSFLSKKEFLNYSRIHLEERKHTRRQKLVFELSKLLVFIDSHRIRHEQVSAFGESTATWTIAGRFVVVPPKPLEVPSKD